MNDFVLTMIVTGAMLGIGLAVHYGVGLLIPERDKQ